MTTATILAEVPDNDRPRSNGRPTASQAAFPLSGKELLMNRHSSHVLTRRRLLQVGGLGIVGLGLPELLWANAGGPKENPNPRAEKSCIFIFQYGGASHIDSLDLKPQAPEGVRGPYKPIATSVPGIQI